MNKIDKINRYIDRTEFKFRVMSPYQLRSGELSELRFLAECRPAEAICLAFKYGCAKGCRAMAAEARKRDAVEVGAEHGQAN